jgi:hypothetical protein
MADRQDIMRADPDDPNRCKRFIGLKQCQFVSVPGSDYCILHGGAGVANAVKKANTYQYRLAKYRARAGELINSSQLKDLREEVAVLRILLEERFNACDNASELILHSSTMGDLVMKINTLVTSCHKLDTLLGTTLDKSTLLGMAEQIINIIAKHVKDSSTIEYISKDIADMLDPDAK